ncbi:hypothetical protein BRC88_09635 [Halobacteriales archaeon QS_4_69_225]|nr:MAG: hypothetical protein BRC88_09635 [Halobacteriales archaeon QS_4_69_225]
MPASGRRSGSPLARPSTPSPRRSGRPGGVPGGPDGPHRRRFGGAVYLSSLGVGRLRRPATEARDLDGSPYLQGLIVNVLSPQVALFFLAFFPGVAPESAPAAGMVVPGALYALVATVSLGGVGALSGRFGGGGRWARVGSGIALLGIAAWLVATDVAT